MKHIIWTPRSKKDPWIETICAIKVNTDEGHTTTIKDQWPHEIVFSHPHIKRQSRDDKCLECFGPNA